MTTVHDEYRDWMLDLVSCGEYDARNYEEMFDELDSTEFISLNPFDDNRIEDAYDLRRIFSDEYGYTEDDMYFAVNKKTSVLEVLVALAKRGEDDIMWNPDKGDRTGLWFWEMMRNIGLAEYDVGNFDKREVDSLIDAFIFREYDKNGCGGAFYLPWALKDVRNMDLWTQMNWYFTRLLESEE